MERVGAGEMTVRCEVEVRLAWFRRDRYWNMFCDANPPWLLTLEHHIRTQGSAFSTQVTSR